MPLTLSRLLQRTLRKLGDFHEANATGGSATTGLVDALAEEGGDDDWNEGTFFVVRDGGGAGAAPEGEMIRITDYVDGTGTFSFAALTATVDDGDTVGYSGPTISLPQLIGLANDAMEFIGDIPTIDTTSLDTAAAQTELVAQKAWGRGRPYRLDIQTVTGDADDNRWMPITDWEYIVGGVDATGLIILDFQPVASRDVRVHYMDSHPRVNIFSDVIWKGWHPELIIHASYLMCVRWLNDQRRSQEPHLVSKLRVAEVEMDRLKSIHPTWQPPEKPRYKWVGLEAPSNALRLPHPPSV